MFLGCEFNCCGRLMITVIIKYRVDCVMLGLKYKRSLMQGGNIWI